MTSFAVLIVVIKPSHHIPYLYALADAASKGQMRIRQIAQTDYNATVNGLSGVCVMIVFWIVSLTCDMYRMKTVAR